MNSFDVNYDHGFSCLCSVYFSVGFVIEKKLKLTWSYISIFFADTENYVTEQLITFLNLYLLVSFYQPPGKKNKFRYTLTLR